MRQHESPKAQLRRELVYRDPASLKAYDRNARVHSPEQIRQIRASIDRFGFNAPVLLKDDDTTIGAGHGRVAAALLDPPLAEVPTITLRGLTEEQWRAYVLADNRLALASDWDLDVLRQEVEDLVELDLTEIGFSELELSLLRLDREEGVNDPDAEWVGMPEFAQADRMAYRSLIVHFADQAAVDDFARRVKQTFSPKAKFIWHPKAEIETAADKRYVQDKRPGHGG